MSKGKKTRMQKLALKWIAKEPIRGVLSKELAKKLRVSNRGIHNVMVPLMASGEVVRTGNYGEIVYRIGKIELNSSVTVVRKTAEKSAKKTTRKAKKDSLKDSVIAESMVRLFNDATYSDFDRVYQFCAEFTAYFIGSPEATVATEDMEDPEVSMGTKRLTVAMWLAGATEVQFRQVSQLSGLDVARLKAGDANLTDIEIIALLQEIE